jgi:hypothetical protein
VILLDGGAVVAEPIRLHPDNPHYLQFRGRPTVLITAGEHYGAVLNLDFDYLRYLDVLQDHGFNLTRIFSGTYREVPGSFGITGNTLAPAAGRFVCPWARSETPGASDGGNKFDFTKWDEAYFARLKDFIAGADRRGVVVELVFFCTMYDEKLWDASPMNVRNNVNGVGAVGRQEVYNAKDKDLLAAQQAVVRKLVTELNEFDNLYYEVCNEPYERGGLTSQWNDLIVAAVVETEATFPQKHLIAQGFPRSGRAISGLNPHVSILNFHAATPDAVRLNYPLNRIVAFDETGGSDRSDRKYRTEGWEFILAGGGVYDHLDFSFTPEREDGAAVPLPPGTPGGGGPQLRRQLQILKEFVEGFDIIRMAPANGVVKVRSVPVRACPEPAEGAFRGTGILPVVQNHGQDAHATETPRGVTTNTADQPRVSVLAEVGRAYAVYVNGGTQAQLEMDLPPGAYQAEWINTKTGGIDQTETFGHAAGPQALTSPAYAEDIALRVIRQGNGR